MSTLLISIWKPLLTHLPLDKMTTISQTIFQMHFREWKVLYFSCDQAALRTLLSVCLSVRLLHLFHYVPIIVSSLPMTKVMSMQKVKVRGQRSRSQTPLSRFRTVTPVWIHIWWWNDAYSLIMLRRGALWFFKVIHQISRSHGSKNLRIWPRLGVSGM